MKRRIAYDQTEANQKLLKHSKNLFDLTSERGLQQERLESYRCSSSYFDLHYWNQRVDDEVLNALQSLADECDLVGQFKEMKSGAVMNNITGLESEERQVLHTACRDIFEGEPCEPYGTMAAVVELAKLKGFLEELESGKITNAAGEPFTTFINVGIGGSDLGPRSVYEALKAYRKEGREVYFISNVDPDDAVAVLQGVDLEKSIVSIVSKSGTTLETLTNETLVKQAFMEKGLDVARHFIAVTGKGSPMDNPEKYLRSFYMFDYIGGRYSTTSMVGLVMLGFALGYGPAEKFLFGAATVDYEAEQRDIRNNTPLLLALIGLWNRCYLGMNTQAILPYAQALHRFTAHLQQCDMESNGKTISRSGERISGKTGPIIWGEPGTNGQHAFYQLLHQGSEIVPCDFIGFRVSQRGKDVDLGGTTSQQKLIANMLAQSVALASGKDDHNPNRFFPGNRPSSVLVAEKLTPEVMGALLAIYEAKIIFQGFAWNVNSFDQEGVQLGKVLANRFLEEIRSPQGEEISLERSILKATGMA